jgi:hypothetical protein
MTLGQLDAENPVDYDILVADWQREQEICSKCGRPLSICSDPEVQWFPQRTICYAEMATAQVRWQWEQLHGDQFHDGSFEAWSKSRSAAFPFAADDGTSLWVSTENLTPDDDFLETGGG